MLKKENRIKHNKDFEKVFRVGKYSFGPFIDFKTVKNEITKSRFGIVVSKKISKKAVVRNKIKRQLRSVLKKEENGLNKGVDVILIPKKEVLTKNYAAIKEEIKTQLKKNKLS